MAVELGDWERPASVCAVGMPLAEDLPARMLSLCSCVVADFGADASFSIGARSMRRRGRVCEGMKDVEVDKYDGSI